MTESKGDQRGSLRRLLGFVNGYRMAVAAIGLLLIIQSAGQLGMSWFVGQAIDAGVAGNLSGLGSTIGSLLLVTLVLELAFILRYRTAHCTAERIVYDIRRQAVGQLGRATVAGVEGQHSGEFVSRLSSDMALVRGMLATDMVMVVRGVIAFFSALAMMLLISWRVTLLSMTVGPVIMVVATALGGPMKRHTEAMQHHGAKLNSLAQDAAGGIAMTKAFGLPRVLGERFGESSQQVALSGIRLATSQGVMTGVVGFLSLLPFFILFGVGGYEAISGRLSLGDLLMLLNLMNNLTWPLEMMGQYLAKIKAGLTACERLFALIDLPQERTTGEALVVAPAERYAIELCGVRFGYGEGKPIFDQLDLRIPQGEMVAIVGPSGTGKSTLLALLLGLREAQAGEIRLYGQSMRQLSLSSLRQLMAYVPQEATLFPVSVADNIAQGRLSATGDQLRCAAEQAFAEEFIVNLPHGYDTLLGEQGVGLSGGQRQRIALARAVLRQAPILLLDEATSALDTESEAKVQAAIEALSHGRTTVVVAHRLSTIRASDRIIVIDQGRVVEEGCHQGLLEANGLYATLYHEQSGRSDPGVALAGR